MITKEFIGLAIVEMRKKRGLTQAKLARLMGLTQQKIFYAESHNGVVSLNMAIEVAEKLGFKFEIVIKDLKVDDKKNIHDTA
jgi:DNA-binding XRE family transcriptional regulator